MKDEWDVPTHTDGVKSESESESKGEPCPGCGQIHAEPILKLSMHAYDDMQASQLNILGEYLALYGVEGLVQLVMEAMEPQ